MMTQSSKICFSKFTPSSKYILKPTHILTFEYIFRVQEFFWTTWGEFGAVIWCWLSVCWEFIVVYSTCTCSQNIFYWLKTFKKIWDDKEEEELSADTRSTYQVQEVHFFHRTRQFRSKTNWVNNGTDDLVGIGHQKTNHFDN